jgi:uncharacterized membrane protein YphA (DoxX/SURF4 family)
MKRSLALKNAVIDTVCLLYILLFAYAAVSKILDYENFRIQLGQSPLLSSFAGIIAWLVPAIEIIIAISLMIVHLRKVSLFLGYLLMCMFTAYIYIILHFSSFIPCSCGGILEKLGWTEHLFFNMAYVLLAIIGLLLLYSGNGPQKKEVYEK